MFTPRSGTHDPFLDLIGLLRPKATLWGGIEGAGKWAVSFRKRDDVLFCWVEQGECQLTRPHFATINLRRHDFALIRTSTPFAFTTDPTIEPIDSETVVSTTQNLRMTLGGGTDARVSLLSGRFVFDTANENLLTSLLPQLVHISADDTSSWRMRALLQMNDFESRHPGPGSDFFVARLMELVLVDVLRNAQLRVGEQHAGLLAGLADPITASALSAMHADVAHGWTVANLARISGVSRSSFAERFQKTVGTGPIDYLLKWRMALAKDELRRRSRSIGEIAIAIGFQSPSAFSTAFTRAVGCSPKNYIEGLDTGKALMPLR